MKERCYNCGSDKHLALQCPYIKTGPAPKEEEMEIEKYCHQHKGYYSKSQPCEKCTAERRAVARDAYMAALGGIMTHEGQCGGFKFSDMQTAEYAETIALETVRRWDAFMAAVDAEGGE